ncbi:MAG: sulfatase-like hydrolase/transferase, partial [Muribaculaceae bacterium]|nr:sulfatase-like hydrolase/transferase [Muribaculaceae bacterium]
YCRDARFNGKDDFDGTWAIWDEEFLQFFALKMTEMPQPFVTGVFTASSHHPFAIPERYRERFPDEGLHQLHKCIRYTDYSLGRFFETASRQPWYQNTIFVLTADHASSKTTHDVYKTDAGHNMVPILIFDPSGEMPRGVMPGLMQQLDILPTVLGWLGYDRDFIAFGTDALSTSAADRWAFNWIFTPQLYVDGYFIQTDTECQPSALYAYPSDVMMQHNLIDSLPDVRTRMTDKIKGLMQSYFERMEADSVRIMP